MLWSICIHKKSSNGKVFTKIATFEIELVVSTRPLQKEFYNNKRIDKASA